MRQNAIIGDCMWIETSDLSKGVARSSERVRVSGWSEFQLSLGRTPFGSRDSSETVQKVAELAPCPGNVETNSSDGAGRW